VQGAFKPDAAARQIVRQTEVEMNAQQQQTDGVRIRYINRLNTRHNDDNKFAYVTLIYNKVGGMHACS